LGVDAGNNNGVGEIFAGIVFTSQAEKQNIDSSLAFASQWLSLDRSYLFEAI